jgi:hypothetical protein
MKNKVEKETHDHKKNYTQSITDKHGTKIESGFGFKGCSTMSACLVHGTELSNFYNRKEENVTLPAAGALSVPLGFYQTRCVHFSYSFDTKDNL